MNHSLLPSAEQRAQACSTKERGIRAASSISIPPRVTPCIRAWEDSSLPPNRKNVLLLPRKLMVSLF